MKFKRIAILVLAAMAGGCGGKDEAVPSPDSDAAKAEHAAAVDAAGKVEYVDLKPVTAADAAKNADKKAAEASKQSPETTDH